MAFPLNFNRWWCRLLFVAVALTSLLRARAAPTEYEAKAVFLFYFTQFVEWPESTFSSPTAPFVIGVEGEDPFGHVLADVVHGESVGRHPLAVRHVDSVEDARGCQILYISRGSERRVPLKKLQGAPVLTVGESDTFLDAGGIVQFFTERRHLHLRINLTAARSHSLIISAKLLRVAEVTSRQPSIRDGFGSRFAFSLPPPSALSENEALHLFAAVP